MFTIETYDEQAFVIVVGDTKIYVDIDMMHHFGRLSISSAIPNSSGMDDFTLVDFDRRTSEIKNIEKHGK